MDLKNYRAPRAGAWPWIAAIAVTLALTCVVGPMDRADALSVEADNKVLRAELAATRPAPRASIAPLGMNCRPRQFYADQSDGGPWLVRCVDADLRVQQ